MRKKNNLLIVDDDKTFLLSLKDGLIAYNKEYIVHTAFNGKEAVAILDANHIDLIITDIKMPEMDGFELLMFVSKKYSNIPVIVTTAFGTEKIEQRVRHMYLEKPLDFNVLVILIKNCLDEQSAGFVSGIDLTSILQLVEMEKQTCTLLITSDEKKGEMSFENGLLINAETDTLKGDKAAYSIVLWGKSEIEIVNKTINKKNITKTLNHILIDAHREIDEKKKSTNKKEENMNVEKLNEAIGGLKKDLGVGLLAVDFWAVADGQSLAGFNTQPKACALFTQLTADMNKTLEGSEFPIIGKYYILDLANKNMVIIIPLGDYMCGMLLDKDNTKLGLVLNIGIPKVIDTFEEAIVS